MKRHRTSVKLSGSPRSGAGKQFNRPQGLSVVDFHDVGDIEKIDLGAIEEIMKRLNDSQVSPAEGIIVNSIRMWFCRLNHLQSHLTNRLFRKARVINIEGKARAS